MDVRCDRCETEYELDDAIVTETGASVQCTTCGHTFMVTRMVTREGASSSPAPTNASATTPAAGINGRSGSEGATGARKDDGAGPDVPEWTLSTDDGKVHRFRDLNTLQKWIVERKVTRTERISRLGGPWLSLGDVVELAPFFSVVDEADRARAAISTQPSSRPPPGMIPPSASRGASGARAGSPSSPGVSSPPPPPADARGRVSEDGPTVPNRRLFGTNGESPSSRSSEPPPGIRPPDDRTPSGSAHVAAARAAASSPRQSARTELVFEPGATEARLLDSDLLLEPRHTGRNVAIAAVVLLVAGGAGAWWWSTRGPGGVGDGRIASAPAHPTPATAGPMGDGTGTPGAKPVEAKPDPKAEATKSEPTPPQAAETPPDPIAAARPANGAAGHEGKTPDTKAGEATPPNAPVRGRAGAPVGSTKGLRAGAEAGGAPGRAGSYEQLVREADRLLDAGKAAKADKLYAQALAARPDGVAALTGSAYVLLDRQRHFKAIETFRKALAVQPAYGPALFGIAESYRARGDTAQALGAYRQYLAVAPSGTDAPAARRQIKDLESASTPTSVEPPSAPANPDP